MTEQRQDPLAVFIALLEYIPCSGYGTNYMLLEALFPGRVRRGGIVTVSITKPGQWEDNHKAGQKRGGENEKKRISQQGRHEKSWKVHKKTRYS